MAKGASIIPIRMTVGAVTTGGIYFIKFFTPTSLMSSATSRYTSPEIRMPPVAYDNFSCGDIAIPAKIPALGSVINCIPTRNAKDDPRKAGTRPLAKK
jgi:hypothetical protein